MIDQLINSIRAVEKDPSQAPNLASWLVQIESMDPQQVGPLLSALVDIKSDVADHSLDPGLQPVIAALLARTEKTQEELQPEWINSIRQLYESSPPTSPLRNY